jgi:Tol biopolymer transport system component
LDIYTASRATTADQWSTPTNLGPLINSTGNDARPTLSRDGLTLLFGSNRAGGDGQSDIYISQREKLTGDDQ